MEVGVVIGGNTRGNAREVLKVLATCAANDVLPSICRVLSETEKNKKPISSFYFQNFFPLRN